MNPTLSDVDTSVALGCNINKAQKSINPALKRNSANAILLSKATARTSITALPATGPPVKRDENKATQQDEDTGFYKKTTVVILYSKHSIWSPFVKNNVCHEKSQWRICGIEMRRTNAMRPMNFAIFSSCQIFSTMVRVYELENKTSALNAAANFRSTIAKIYVQQTKELTYGIIQCCSFAEYE